MTHIYLDNFRGFTDCILPIDKVSFLVGENSTGKTSFLKAVGLLSDESFCQLPRFPMDGDHALGDYSDIVSATSRDQSSFRMGKLHIKPKKGGAHELSFRWYEFEERKGQPRLKQYRQYGNGILALLVNHDSGSEMVSEHFESEHPSIESAMTSFGELIRRPTTVPKPVRRWKAKGVNVGSDVPLFLLLAGSINQEDQERHRAVPDLNDELFAGMMPERPLTSLAPIRSEPQRIFDPRRRAFSSSGTHTPVAIAEMLAQGSQDTKDVQRLQRFGAASGLFDRLGVTKYSEAALSPFDIVLTLTDAQLSISNVGYGVSQVLPIVVEALTRPTASRLAIQQPEVHLHPRAQAALGGLLFDLARRKKMPFLVETHSDFLIDRFRLEQSKNKNKVEAQVLFFRRTASGNQIEVIEIAENGTYSSSQSDEFRAFFIKEELAMLTM